MESAGASSEGVYAPKVRRENSRFSCEKGPKRGKNPAFCLDFTNLRVDSIGLKKSHTTPFIENPAFLDFINSRKYDRYALSRLRKANKQGMTPRGWGTHKR
jgi:hypothetical protein